MKNNIIILISVIILSIALIFSSVYIGNSINNASLLRQEASLTMAEKLLMSSEQAADYLGIPLNTFVSMLKSETIEKQNLSMYPTYKFIPFIAIEGEKYFNKIELQRWVEFNMHNK